MRQHSLILGVAAAALLAACKPADPPAAPAAVAGYALVHGVTKESVPSEIWRQIFCIIGGGFVGISALLRLAAPSASGPTPVR